MADEMENVREQIPLVPMELEQPQDNLRTRLRDLRATLMIIAEEQNGYITCLKLGLVTIYVYSVLSQFIGFPAHEKDHPTMFSCKPNLVVAVDGSGDFKSIMEAVAAAKTTVVPFCIFIKTGIYEESLYIEKPNILLVGEGTENTLVRSSSIVTLTVAGDGFGARNLTFQNYGRNGRNVMVTTSNKIIVLNSHFIGNRGSLNLSGKMHFFKYCEIYGSGRIIYGHALATFQHCKIYIRNSSVVTYQEKVHPHSSSGFVFYRCLIDAHPSGITLTGTSYLGSPGAEYSTVAVMKTFIGGVINPEGWITRDNYATQTVYYGEFKNEGPSGMEIYRVKWRGFKILNVSRGIKF